MRVRPDANTAMRDAPNSVLPSLTPRLLMASVRKHGEALRYPCGLGLRADAAVTLQAVVPEPLAMADARCAALDRPLAVRLLAAVRKDGQALRYASDAHYALTLRLYWMRCCSIGWHWCTHVIRHVPTAQFIRLWPCAKLGQPWPADHRLGQRRTSYPDMVLDAVDEYPRALAYAHGAALVLSADRTVVLAAVRKVGRALRYASYDLRC